MKKNLSSNAIKAMAIGLSITMGASTAISGVLSNNRVIVEAAADVTNITNPTDWTTLIVTGNKVIAGGMIFEVVTAPTDQTIASNDGTLKLVGIDTTNSITATGTANGTIPYKGNITSNTITLETSGASLLQTFKVTEIGKIESYKIDASASLTVDIDDLTTDIASVLTTLNNEILPTVTKIDAEAFKNGINSGLDLSNLDLDKAVELTEIGANAFEGAILAKIDLTKMAKVTTIGANAFKNVTISGAVNLGSTVLTTLTAGAFENATITGEVDLSGATALTTLTTAFKGTDKQNKTKLNGGLKLPTKLATIDTNALQFVDLKSATLDIPSTVTEIKASAFADSKLTNLALIIPATVITLGANVFKGTEIHNLDLSALLTLGTAISGNNASDLGVKVLGTLKVGSNLKADELKFTDSATLDLSADTKNASLATGMLNGAIARKLNLPSNMITIASDSKDTNTDIKEIKSMATDLTVPANALDITGLTTVYIPNLTNASNLDKDAFGGTNPVNLYVPTKVFGDTKTAFASVPTTTVKDYTKTGTEALTAIVEDTAKDKVVLTFDENVKLDGTLSPTDFTVVGTTTTSTVVSNVDTSTFANDKKITLTLDKPLVASETLTLDYTTTGTNGKNSLTFDGTGVKISSQTIGNKIKAPIADKTAPTIDKTAPIYDEVNKTITLTADEDLTVISVTGTDGFTLTDKINPTTSLISKVEVLIANPKEIVLTLDKALQVGDYSVAYLKSKGTITDKATNPNELEDITGLDFKIEDNNNKNVAISVEDSFASKIIIEPKGNETLTILGTPSLIGDDANKFIITEALSTTPLTIKSIEMSTNKSNIEITLDKSLTGSENLTVSYKTQPTDKNKAQIEVVSGTTEDLVLADATIKNNVKDTTAPTITEAIYDTNAGTLTLKASEILKEMPVTKGSNGFTIKETTLSPNFEMVITEVKILKDTNEIVLKVGRDAKKGTYIIDYKSANATTPITDLGKNTNPHKETELKIASGFTFKISKLASEFVTDNHYKIEILKDENGKETNNIALLSHNPKFTPTITRKVASNSSLVLAKNELKNGKVTIRGKEYTLTQIGNGKPTQWLGKHPDGSNNLDNQIDAVTIIAENAFTGDNAKLINGSNFPAVTTIGKNAFNGNKAVTNLSFPKAITIGEGAFAGTTKLEKIDLGSKATSTNVSEGAFAGSNSKLKIETNASSVDKIKNIVKKDIPNIDVTIPVVTPDTTPDTKPDTDNNTSSGGGGGGSSSAGAVIGNTGGTSTDEVMGNTTGETSTTNTIKEILKELNRDVTNLPTLSDVAVKFSDIKADYWAKSYIEKLAKLGIVSGDNGSFNANGNTKRADVTIMLIKLLGLQGEATSNFNDVNPAAYYSNYVGLAKEYGIVNGSNGNFNPESTISRQDTMVMIAQILDKLYDRANKDTSVLANFKDSTNISNYAKESVATLINAGIITGNNGYIKAKDNVSRAEMATIISKVYDLLSKS